MEAPALNFPETSVACPACGSTAGRLCTSHNGSRYRRDTVHQARRAAWGALQTSRAKARAAHVAAQAAPPVVEAPVETPPVDDIEHGTPRGYGQHRTRKVPFCQPCRDALNAQNRERRAAARQGWNRGLAGEPTAPAPVPTGRDCPVAECGELATAPQPSARMVHVVWPYSREPGRWYCPGPCQAYGMALAEIRAIEEVGTGA